MTRRVLLRCDSTGDLYPITTPSLIPHAFLVSQHTWHQHLRHLGSEVLRRLVSHNFISCDKEKHPILCHAFQLGKHVRLSFVSSDTVVTSCFDSIHSDVWTSPIPSLSGFKYYPIHQLDVKNAFLYGGLSETVYMHQPSGFRDFVHPDYVCLLQRHGMDTAYLLLYIDDIVLTASSHALLQQIITALHQEFSMTDLGSQNYFLGIIITRDSSRMFLSQKKYVVEFLEKAHMICLYMHDPCEPHLSALKRILSPTTQRSTSGYCVFLGNNLLSWSSKRQPTLSRSSEEAEYRGVTNVVAETCWLRNLLCELHTLLSFTTLVYCDNVSVVYLSCHPVQHQRTKHIDIDIHFVRDLVVAVQVRVLHVPSRYQYADIFTKGLPSALFEEFRTSLNVRCPPVPTAGDC
ncbi:ribonuclease H-like domain-containing protein [Tanacetum coccineum]|uniref:Ribonuclease H-like domain-containing protein n=1 Tax=Tanacetum coccineum TaxID=301880 RepID=A0ABQ5HND6_9ASTR